MDQEREGNGAVKKVSLHPYLSNVRITIFNNVRWFLQHVEEKEEDTEAERFLLAVVAYCHKLINDPSKREKKRVRTRHGSGSSGKVAAAERSS